MGLENLSNLSEDIQHECKIIKNILLSLCEGKAFFQKNEYQVRLEYMNRELIMTVNEEVISTLSFEIIYFELKKDHLDSSKYEEAIINLLNEELDKISLQKYA